MTARDGDGNQASLSDLVSQLEPDLRSRGDGCSGSEAPLTSGGAWIRDLRVFLWPDSQRHNLPPLESWPGAAGPRPHKPRPAYLPAGHAQAPLSPPRKRPLRLGPPQLLKTQSPSRGWWGWGGVGVSRPLQSSPFSTCFLSPVCHFCFQTEAILKEREL